VRLVGSTSGCDCDEEIFSPPEKNNMAVVGCISGINIYKYAISEKLRTLINGPLAARVA